jgi:hypothetical protein
MKGFIELPPLICSPVSVLQSPNSKSFSAGRFILPLKFLKSMMQTTFEVMSKASICNLSSTLQNGLPIKTPEKFFSLNEL